MTEKRFVDIEIGADIGQIRLYTTDEDYETYGSEDILNLLNEQNDKIYAIEEIIENLKKEGFLTKRNTFIALNGIKDILGI